MLTRSTSTTTPSNRTLPQALPNATAQSSGGSPSSPRTSSPSAPQAKPPPATSNNRSVSQAHPKKKDQSSGGPPSVETNSGKNVGLVDVITVDKNDNIVEILLLPLTKR